MAKYLTHMDLNQNELQNAVIQPLATAPTNGVLGQLYYNTTNKSLFQYNGNAWAKIGALYNMSLGAAASNTVPLKLVGSDGTNDTVNIKGTGGTTLSVSGNTLTISTSNTNTTYTFTGAAAADKYLITIKPSSGTNQTITIPLATASLAGLISPAEKSNLEQLTKDKLEFEMGALFDEGNYTYLHGGTAGVGFEIGNTSKNKVSVGNHSNGWKPVATMNDISDAIAASDAMIFKGTIGTSGTITTLPTTYKTGWTYRVIAAGIYAENKCEVGDLIIALVDRAGTGNVNADWTVAQTNIDGAITAITGTSLISVTGSGASRTITHTNSGVAAGTYGPTANINPSFGDAFVVPSITENAAGHTTSAVNRIIGIPRYVATDEAPGLMSARDKIKLDGVPQFHMGKTTIATGKTATTFNKSSSSAYRLLSYVAMTSYNKEQVIVDVTDMGSMYVFSISKAYTEDIIISVIEAYVI